jgi:hypothetical protein
MLENIHKQHKNVLQKTLKKPLLPSANPKNKPKPKINFKKQLEKVRLHTGQINNF